MAIKKAFQHIDLTKDIENIKIYTEEFLRDSEYFIVDVVRGSSNKKTSADLARACAISVLC